MRRQVELLKDLELGDSSDVAMAPAPPDSLGRDDCASSQSETVGSPSLVRGILLSYAIALRIGLVARGGRPSACQA